ncbi:hypothetical protein I552_1364 [Mycobacterium xenopi 3993]|nr:hypothetical protein I552_1364 [Mycobacterium xenopi 3993]
MAGSPVGGVDVPPRDRPAAPSPPRLPAGRRQLGKVASMRSWGLTVHDVP